MCFITYWTGCSTENGFPAHSFKEKRIDKRDLIEKYYQVVPIHKRHDLVDETIRLINSHWPKSRSERLSILCSSNEDLPMSLIVTFRRKKPDLSEETRIINDIFFDRQRADAPTYCSVTGRPIKVLGHLRLVPVPADDKACFVESMVIHNDFRGKGLGSYFIRETEKFCEDVLHLKSIFLSTYDSGEFYMKIGFQLTSAICVYGAGEVNTVTKKIFLKKDLNYVEPEEPEETVKDIYDPNKDYNYKQQQQIETDVILSGFPFKMEQSQGIVVKLCQLIDFDSRLIRYFYSFEYLNRENGRRSFHMIISTSSIEVRNILMKKLDEFGVLCFQNFFEKPVNDYDNTLITHEARYTNLNYVIRHELTQLKVDKWISDFKYENFQFHAKQNDEWIVVRNLEIVDFLKTPEVPDVPEKEIEGWDATEESDRITENLEKLREHFKSKAADEWWPSVRRPSEIILEPFAATQVMFQFKDIEKEDSSSGTWVEKIQSCNDATELNLREFHDREMSNDIERN